MAGSNPRVVLDGRLLGYRPGGIQRHVRGLLRHLPQVAPDLSFVVAVNRPDRAPRFGVPVARVLTPPHHRLGRLTLALELAARRPALSHSPDFIAPVRLGWPRVVTVHDLAFLKHPELLAPDAERYYRQVARLRGGTERIIAVSHATAADIQRLLGIPPERIRVIYNGVDDEFFAPDTGDANAVLAEELPPTLLKRLAGDRPIVLAVGTIEPRKRHVLLLDAVEQLPQANGQMPLLVLVGARGWRCESIVARVECAQGAGSTIWLQSVSDRGLRALYRIATLLAMPSSDEGFGLPVVEAMACGLPVIAASRGALPEVVGEAGILLDSDDAADWAATIDGLLEDPGRRRALSVLGRRRAASFRWPAAAAATAQLYREALAE